MKKKDPLLPVDWLLIVAGALAVGEMLSHLHDPEHSFFYRIIDAWSRSEG